MKCFTICYSLLINVCYPVTRGKAQSDYTAPHTAQIVTSSKKHSASFGDELNQSQVISDTEPSSFLSRPTRETVSSPTQHSSVLPRQHLSSTAELIGAGGGIKHHAASPLPGCTEAGCGTWTSGSPACISLCLFFPWFVRCHWHWFASATQHQTNSRNFKIRNENQLRPFNKDPSGHDQDWVCARTD